MGPHLISENVDVPAFLCVVSNELFCIHVLLLKRNTASVFSDLMESLFSWNFTARICNTLASIRCGLLGSHLRHISNAECFLRATEDESRL